MKTKVKKINSLKQILLIILLLLPSLPVKARLLITTGSTEKKQWIMQMLQSASYPVTPPVGVVNLDTITGIVSISGAPPNTFFGLTLKRIIDDTSRIEVMLDKVINGRPVFIGAFNGGVDGNVPANGKQSIDVNDLKKLDSVGTGGIGSWQPYLLHELFEQFVGWKYSLTYIQSHDSALKVESDMIKVIGGSYYVRYGEVHRGNTLIIIYTDTATGQLKAVRFNLNEVLQIDTVQKGLINNLKIRHVSGGCSGGLCGFSEGQSGIIYEPLPGSNGLNGAEYLIKDERGNIYGALPQQSKVVRLNHEGIVDIQYQHSNLTAPSGLAFDPVSEELFAGCSSQNRLVVFDVSGAYKRTLAPEGLSMTAGLDIDPERNIYISSHGNNCIIYMSPEGKVIRYISHSSLQGPAGLVYADGLERLLVVSNSNNKILVFSKTGTYMGEFGSAANLGSPWGIGILGGKFNRTFALGNLYIPLNRVAVTNANANGIVIFNSDGSVRHNLSQAGFQPKAMLITQTFDFTPIAVNKISSEIPVAFQLEQNYPNPFNPKTNIEFALSKSAFVKLVIYDILSREIETIVNNQLTAGTYKVDWNASKYSSGVYFYKLITDNFTETKKMILIK